MISIVVPVYNVQDYLAECVKSIFAQTYRDWELLLVDDGSTDKSGELCDAYALGDSRVRVIHKPNGGASEARNSAFAAFRGEYVLCVDPDDYLDPQALEIPLKTLLANDADIVISGMRHFAAGNTIRVINPPSRTCTAKEAIKLLLTAPSYMNPIWNKLCRRELLCDFQCKPYATANDLAVSYQVLHRSRRVVVIPDVLYHYRIREDSLTTAPFGLKQMDSLRCFDDMAADIRAWYPDFEPLVCSGEARFALFRLRSATLSHPRCREVERALAERILKNRRALTKSNGVPRSIIWESNVLRLGLPFYHVVRTLYRQVTVFGRRAHGTRFSKTNAQSVWQKGDA
ncbi:MAG: glycosyltransferase family 2 protein [Clostridia bacterium]